MKKERPIGNALILCAITLVAGLLLSFVNELTIGPIKQAQLAAQAEAYVSVYPDAASFGEVEGTDELLKAAATEIPAAGYTGGSVTDVMTALDGSGNVIGYVLSAVSKNGYGGDITIALGVDLNGTITGFSPLQHSETPGFGAKCEDASFTGQFPGLTSADDIDGIAGATFTTTAIKEAVGAGLYFVDQMLLAGS